jgi:hypothetical protein
MSRVNEVEIEDGVFEEIEARARTDGAALVPTEAVQCARRLATVRQDASFVAQLIATAEQLPQTRHLRRAAPADALSAYRLSENRIRDARGSTHHAAQTAA